MKTLALLIAMAAVSAGQSGEATVAGSWTAQFEGRTFVRLELETASGIISGAISLGNIEVDQQGALRHVREAPKELTPIFDVAERASTVTFSRKNGEDTDRFEWRLLEPGHAELHLLLDDDTRKELAADGIPAPKPILLTKH